MIERLTSFFDDRALESELLRLFDTAQGRTWVAAVALVVAAGIGMLHAIGPGHGKLVIGAYLASTDGRRRDAVALGAIVAAMHTASVLVVGLVFDLTARAPGGERLEPVLSFVSAVAVVAVGSLLLTRQLRRRRRAPGRVPVAAGPGPDVGGPREVAPCPGDHSHDHELPDGVAPLSRAGVFALASSGGLLPSPAAFLVLASAMAVGRTGFGLALVAAFGLGLGATLTVLGLLVVWGRDTLVDRVRHRPAGRRVVQTVPLLGAAAVVVGGLVLAAAAVTRL